MIEIRGLTVRYGSLTALDGVWLEVQPGQILGLIGPNGAGKTTLIRTIAGLILPEAGEVRLAGYDALRDESRAHRSMGFMPDFFGLYDRLSVREYLEFFGKLQGLRGMCLDSAIDQALGVVRLKVKKDDLVDHLSRGMAQRLAVARMLVHDPQVYLLDEPASGMDPAARLEFWELLRWLAGRGKTVLISSHILRELEGVATHVALLERGRILRVGPLAEFLSAGDLARRKIRLCLGGEGAFERASGLLEANDARVVNLPEAPGWTLDVPDDDARVARLIRCLVEAGVEVAVPAVEDASLEDAYLRLSGREPS